MKCSNRMYNFWKRVEDIMNLHDADAFINEQAVVNDIIHKSDIKWSLFPDTIWAYSNQPMPHDIHLHHANVTMPEPGKSSLEKKKDQILMILAETSSAQFAPVTDTFASFP